MTITTTYTKNLTDPSLRNAELLPSEWRGFFASAHARERPGLADHAATIDPADRARGSLPPCRPAPPP